MDDLNADLDVTLFVPCYNEEQNIGGALQSIVTACRQVGCSYEIIVIDDASTDASTDMVGRFQADHPGVRVRLVTNPLNQGLASNYVTAAKLGRGRYIRIVCGDNVEPV